MSSSMQPPKSDKPRKVHNFKKWAIVFFSVLGALAVFGIAERIYASSELKDKTEEQAILHVVVMQAHPGPETDEVVLPGNVQAWHEAPIYARTNGYLKDWKTDIGTQVKEGDVLAEIDAPDVDAQFHQAQADLATAVANNTLAQTTYKRWEALLKTNSVSKQEAEEKMGDASAKEAMVASAQANLDRLQQLEDFKHVTAPFSGTVTARNTDVGALINAGSSGTGQELFHMADMTKLRVYTQIPENYAMAIKPGLTTELRLPAYPDRTFAATLDTTSDAIDPVTRTLLVQFLVDNINGELKSGGYAEVHLHVPVTTTNVHLPINTLIFRDGAQVATVDANNKVVLKSITIGRDYGKEIEVVQGIAPGDNVIVNPPDSIENGQDVHIITPGDAAKSGDKAK